MPLNKLDLLLDLIKLLDAQELSLSNSIKEPM